MVDLNAQRLGIKGGLNLDKASYSLSQTSITTTTLTGFQAGITADFPLSSAFFLNASALYSVKGTKLSLLGVQADFPVDYLEIPVNFGYKYSFGGPADVFAMVGPYFGIGLSAKMKSGGNEQNFTFGSGTDQLKRLDAGINYGVGIDISRIQLAVNYGMGLVNISNDSSEKFKNGVLSITLAVFILSAK